MDVLGAIAIIIAVVGAINWGLVGLFKYDLVAKITGAGAFGQVNGLSRLIYIIVGIAGIWALIHWFWIP